MKTKAVTRKQRYGIFALCFVLGAAGCLSILYYHAYHRTARQHDILASLFDTQKEILARRVEAQEAYLFSAYRVLTEGTVLPAAVADVALAGNRERLVTFLQSQYTVLGLNRIRVMLPDGTVVYRAYSPLKRGDRIDSDDLIAAVAGNGEERLVLSGNEQQAGNGITVTLLAPLTYLKQRVGYIGLGFVIDEHFFPAHDGVLQIRGIAGMEGDRRIALYVDPRDPFLAQALTREHRHFFENRFFDAQDKKYIQGRITIDGPQRIGTFEIYAVPVSKEGEHSE